MDFDFSDEQEQLRDAVRKWVDKAYSFDERRSVVAAGGFSASAYQAMAELGLCGLYVQDAYGGMAMGPTEGMVAMEELGRGMVMEPLAHTWISTAVLQAFAPEDLKTEWLPRLAGGEALLVLAHHEKGARHHLNKCQATAVQVGDAWRLSGHKSLVPAGDQAHGFLVPALVKGQQALFLVPRHVTTDTSHAYAAQDGSRMSELHLKDAPAQLITLDGLTALQLAVDVGATALCAEAVGLMEKTLAITVEWFRDPANLSKYKSNIYNV
jgi:alkylation response protein AidB-like acyl-CoA dehydrogenase